MNWGSLLFVLASLLMQKSRFGPSFHFFCQAVDNVVSIEKPSLFTIQDVPPVHEEGIPDKDRTVGYEFQTGKHTYTLEMGYTQTYTWGEWDHFLNSVIYSDSEDNSATSQGSGSGGNAGSSSGVGGQGESGLGLGNSGTPSP